MIPKKRKLFIFSSKTKNIFFMFMLFAVLLAGSSVLSYIVFFPDKTAEVTLGNALKKAVERESNVHHFVDKAKLLVSTIDKSDIFRKYLDAKTNPRELEELFLTLTKAQSDLMQIRYIDKNGMEIIRTERDRDNHSVYLVANNKLQNKKNRYYFYESKHKPLEKIWFSAIDLNIENGKIIKPYLPTLRVIIPIEHNGEFDGIIIVNYYIENFLNSLLNMPLYDVILLNENGYPLIHYEKDKNWAFYKKEKYNISKQFPKYADKILTQKTFKANNFTSRKLDVPIKDGLILILKLKQTYLQEASKQEKYRYMVLFIITFIISALFSIIVVKKFSEILYSLKDKNNDLVNELYYDSLTRLKNRKSLIEDMQRADIKCALLADIQSFSEINDLYGEKVGDAVLKKFTAFLVDSVQDCNPEIYRLHGNTFALLSTTYNTKAEYLSIIQGLMKKLSIYDFSLNLNGTLLQFVINIKIGFAMSENSINLLENADMALNYAKRTNKDFIIYEPSLGIEKKYKEDINVIRKIKYALDNDKIIPYFQPIYKSNMELIGYECLVRLIAEDGNVLTPYHFLDVAKRTRLYFKLTQRMIEKTFKVFDKLPHRFSINFSSLDIKNNDMIEFIKLMLTKYDVSDKLVIEIVESDTFNDYEAVMNFLEDMKSLNVQIAVDDFGSGYSNFSHLIKLDPDYVKIDGSLIKDIDTNEKNYAVTKTIVDFAKDMDMQVIVEFIHSKEVFEKAKTLDVLGYQGFLLGEPQSYVKYPQN